MMRLSSHANPNPNPNPNEPFRYMCRVLGFTRKEMEDLKYEVEQTALYCSYAIVLARYEHVWQPKQLLDVSKWG